MTSKFKEFKKLINHMKKSGNWKPENPKWSKDNWDLLIYDKLKTKRITVAEFVIESCDSIIELYTVNKVQPKIFDMIVPTWYDHMEEPSYRTKLVRWFLRTIIFPDNIVWNDSEKEGVIILPPCEYIWTEEAVQMYNEVLNYYDCIYSATSQS